MLSCELFEAHVLTVLLRVQAELDLRVCQDQVSALKKHNAQLASRCREEAKAKLREHEERVETQDKVGDNPFSLLRVVTTTFVERLCNCIFVSRFVDRPEQLRFEAEGLTAFFVNVRLSLSMSTSDWQ